MFAASSAMKNSIGELEGQIRKRLKPKVVVFRNSEMFEQFVTNVKFSPFTSFQFCFDPMEHTSLDQFLEQHGEKILRLTLPNVYLFMEDLERQFYERMPHLEELVVDRVKLWRKGFPIVLPNYEAKEQSLKGNVPINTTTCPGSFKTLRSFQFENACEPSVVLMFLMVLPKLKILRMGDIDRNYFFEEWTETDNGNYERLVLTKYLEFLSNGEPANKLKVLSLGNEMRDAEHMSDQEIARFIRAINQQHVLVQKVTCTLVNLVWMSNELEEEEKKLFLDSVDNLIDFSPEVSGLVFKSLKSFECLMGNWEFGNFNENFQHPQVTNWSKVEFLSVKLSFSDSNVDDVPGRIGSFLSFVFGIVRPSVKCVQIELDTADESVQMVFNPFAIAYNFPFMESLILKIPYYTSNDFCTLMQNVAENALVLKYLDLTFARSVSSRIFLGTDPNMFTIFKMKGKLIYFCTGYIIKFKQSEINFEFRAETFANSIRSVPRVCPDF